MLLHLLLLLVLASHATTYKMGLRINDTDSALHQHEQTPSVSLRPEQTDDEGYFSCIQQQVRLSQLDSNTDVRRHSSAMTTVDEKVVHGLQELPVHFEALDLNTVSRGIELGEPRPDAITGKCDVAAQNDVIQFPNSGKHLQQQLTTTVLDKESIKMFPNSPNAKFELECFSNLTLDDYVDKINDLFHADEDGDTFLHISIIHHNERISIEIINHAPDFTYLNLVNAMWQTPAHLAVITDANKTLRRLMGAGANITLQDKGGYTPLHIACERGQLESVKVLTTPIQYRETLENQCPIPFSVIPQNFNIQNFDGFNCLHLAVMHNHVGIARYLLEQGADPNSLESKSGRSALHIAAEQGNMEAVTTLLSYPNTDVEVVNYSGYSPLLLAYTRGHLEIVSLLVQHGASLSECLHLLGHCNCESDSDPDTIEL